MKHFYMVILLMLTSPRLSYAALCPILQIDEIQSINEINKSIMNITLYKDSLKDKYTYSQAERACKNKGDEYFLAMPKNSAELKEMNKALKYIDQKAESVMWIGLKRPEPKNENFEYADGTPLVKGSWEAWDKYGLRPDDNYDKSMPYCVEMRLCNKKTDVWNAGINFNGWNDADCNLQRAFFCQYVENVRKWTEWQGGECSVTCGRGTQKDTRRCEGENGACKGNDTRTGSVCVARVTVCPAPSWGSWTEGDCSVTCGEGTKEKTRKCEGGATCPGKGTESGAVCYRESCPEAAWGPWGACSVTCGPGEESRTRDCTGGGNCQGSKPETRVCYTACPGVPPCSGNGGCSHTCVERSGFGFCECPQGLTLGDNELTCEELKEEDEATTQAPKTNDNKALIIAGVVAGGLVLALVVACCFLYKYFCGSKRQERTTEIEGGSSWRVRFSKQSSKKGQKSSKGTSVDTTSDSSSSWGSSSNSTLSSSY